MGILVYLFNLAVDIYIAIIVLQVLVSWLIAFDIIKSGNEQARNLMDLLRRATDPVFKPLRKYIPPIGGIDITPLVVIVLVSVGRQIINGILI